MAYSGKASLFSTEMHILDCVPEIEREARDTSTQLATLVHSKGVFITGSNLTVSRCISANDVRSALQSIVVQAQRGARPILHIDGHASANALSAADGGRIDWDEVYEQFREINILCGNNLFVTMALCEALRSFNRCHIASPCPVNALLAAWNPILQAQVEVGFETFYSKLFDTGGDVDAAVQALRGSLDPCPLLFFTSKQYLEQGILGYVREHCVGEGLLARAKSIADQVATIRPGLKISPEFVMQQLKNEIEDTPAVLRRKARMFLHIDGSPENEQRFASDAEAVIEEAEALLERGTTGDASDVA